MLLNRRDERWLCRQLAQQRCHQPSKWRLWSSSRRRRGHSRGVVVVVAVVDVTLRGIVAVTPALHTCAACDGAARACAPAPAPDKRFPCSSR
jgi:hypothetical protein